MFDSPWFYGLLITAITTGYWQRRRISYAVEELGLDFFLKHSKRWNCFIEDRNRDAKLLDFKKRLMTMFAMIPETEEFTSSRDDFLGHIGRISNEFERILDHEKEVLRRLRLLPRHLHHSSPSGKPPHRQTKTAFETLNTALGKYQKKRDELYVALSDIADSSVAALDRLDEIEFTEAFTAIQDIQGALIQQLESIGKEEALPIPLEQKVADNGGNNVLPFPNPTTSQGDTTDPVVRAIGSGDEERKKR